MLQTLDFELVEIERGSAVFEGTPDRRHYNPIGSVHDGYAATLLDETGRLCASTTLLVFDLPRRSGREAPEG